MTAVDRKHRKVRASGIVGGWKCVTLAPSRKINTWLLYLDEKQTTFSGVVHVAISSVTNVMLKETEKWKKNRYCFRYVVKVQTLFVCLFTFLY
jgi:hypothetical protein